MIFPEKWKCIIVYWAIMVKMKSKHPFILILPRIENIYTYETIEIRLLLTCYRSIGSIVYNQDESPKAFRAFGEWHQNVETKMPSHVHKPTVWSCLCPSRSVLYGQRKVHVFPARMILSKQTTAA